MVLEGREQRVIRQPRLVAAAEFLEVPVGLDSPPAADKLGVGVEEQRALKAIEGAKVDVV